VPVSVEIGEAPGERIVRRVLRDGHDLVLKSVEPQPLGGLAPLDLELLRKCPRPVWLSRPIARPRHEVRVAAAIDPRSVERAGHDLSIDLLRRARTLADLGNGRLAVISCWECGFEGFLLHNPWQAVPHSEIRSVVASEELDHRAALDRVLRESGVGGAISVHHVRGEPGRTIPATADELGVDILVMGTVARTGIPGLLMGNTAETVVRRLACSLVAVKPPGFVSPVKHR
jgi:universal stress protein E